jgi:hypothetical protein
MIPKNNYHLFALKATASFLIARALRNGMDSARVEFESLTRSVTRSSVMELLACAIQSFQIVNA